MFLQLCEETEDIRFSGIISAKQNEGPSCFPKSEIQNDCGQHFGVSGFGVSRVQESDINIQYFLKLRKDVEHFGVSGFGIS
jgi:hypothetical protein